MEDSPDTLDIGWNSGISERLGCRGLLAKLTTEVSIDLPADVQLLFTHCFVLRHVVAVHSLKLDMKIRKKS